MTDFADKHDERAENLDEVTRALMELTSDSAVVAAPDGTILAVNTNAARTFGYDPREARGLPVATLFPDLEADAKRAQQTGAFETTCTDKHGRRFRAVLRMLSRVAGKRDLTVITARASFREKREILRSEGRFQAILDTTTAVIYAKTVQGRYLLVNRRFEEIFNLPKEKIIGFDDHSIFPKEIADRLVENDRAVFAAKRALEFDELVPQEDGLHTYISIKFPLFHENEIYAVCGISTDITERARAESQLVSSKVELEREVAARTEDLTSANLRLRDEITEKESATERLMHLINHTNEGVWTVDIDGSTRFANRRMSELLGYDPEEMVGLEFDRLLFDENREVALKKLEERAAGVEDNYDFKFRRKDGSSMWALVSGSPIRDTQNNVVGSLKLVTDITERKRAEEHQRLLIRELDHRVKNVLATVIGISDLAQIESQAPEIFHKSFRGRVEVLARTHEALALAHWQSVDLGEVTRLVLSQHMSAAGGRLVCSGDPFEVSARASTPLALTLNELATNALKHGALSAAAGRVDLTWTSGPAKDLRLSWIERDGPEVSPPREEGKGIELIRGLIEYELDGRVEMAFDSNGLTCAIVIPPIE